MWRKSFKASLIHRWKRFLNLKNIRSFLFPQFHTVRLDLFSYLGQIHVQVLPQVVEAFFSTLLKLLVLHDLDQFLQQFEVGSLLSFCLLPHAALVVEHEDTEVEDPLEWRRKCCLVRQELGLDNKKGLNTELKEISIYLIVGSAVFPVLVGVLPNFGKSVAHHGNEEVDHDNGDGDLVRSPHQHSYGMGELVRDPILGSMFYCGSFSYAHRTFVLFIENPPE